MLSIIASHFSGHGGLEFPTQSITLNRLWAQLLRCGGSFGNDIFVMLSGYFLINSKGLDFRKLFRLWFRIFFYSVMIYGLFVAAGLEAFSLRTLRSVLMPITKAQWWFASTYFVVYLLHPYLNRFLHSLTEKDYKRFLMTTGFYWCVIPTLTRSAFESSNLVNFMFVYSLAGYFRLHGEELGGKRFLFYFTVCTAMNILLIAAFDVVGLKIPLVGINALRFSSGMTSPITLACASCLLLGFRSLNVPDSKCINLIASATFGVYLIHDNNFVRPFIWCNVFRVASFQQSPYLIPYSLAAILIVYLACTAIELFRQSLFKALSLGRLS